MKNRLSGYIALLLLIIFALSLFSGCTKDNPTSADEDLPDWPDLSEKEDVIETIRLCFQYYDKVPLSELEEHLTNILYQEEENEFIYYPVPEDAGPQGQEPVEDSIKSLAEFVDAAKYIWGNASVLALDISLATWETVELEGCDDCCKTTRTYSFVVTINNSGEILDIGIFGAAEFIVRPQYDDPEKWAIWIIYSRIAR